MALWDDDNPDDFYFQTCGLVLIPRDRRAWHQALYRQAVHIVRRDRKASPSYLCRKLRISYRHADGLVWWMQRDGLVGPMNAAAKREVLAPPPGAKTP